MSEQRAIIDIGSNTVRLVVYGGPPRAPSVRLNEKVTARLGKDIARNNLLPEKGMSIALDALARYAVLLRVMAVKEVRVVATAAVRDAGNGPEFLKAVRNLGFAPRLLSGEEEARTSAMGVIAAFPGARGVAGDLGGGSLELTTIDGKTCTGGITMPFGTLRLPDLRADGPESFDARLHDALASAGWSAGEGQPFFIVGGSWRALARYAMYHFAWPLELDDPHGFELPAEDALKLCRLLERGKIDPEVPRISSSRMATLPDAAALLGGLVRELSPSSIVFSSWGLREGLLYENLDPTVQAEDPMLAGVSTFAASFDTCTASAALVANWTAETARDGTSQDISLRLAAAMLAMASLRIEPNLRSEHAMNWALRKRWIGLDARGRALIAMAVLASTGQTAVPDEFTSLASPEDLNEAIGWGLAIRLCRKLTGCAADALAQTSLEVDKGLEVGKGQLVLSLREPVHALFGNSAGKHLKLLAQWLDLEPSVRMLEADALLE